jgi:hypothetical protein
MSAGVTVNTASGSPPVLLSDGATATYDAVASSPAAGMLVFDYNVGANDYSTDLTVLALNLNGATIKDTNGVNADVSGAANSDLALDVNAAVVTDVTVTPQTGEADSGAKVTLTLAMSGAVTVNTKAGAPTLTLNDGATANYDAKASNLFAGLLVFDYVVAASDHTPSLGIAQLNLNGAIIDGANGKAADFTAVSTFTTNLQIGPATGAVAVSVDATGTPGSNQYALGTVALNQSQQTVLDITNFGSGNLVLNSVGVTDSTGSIKIGSIPAGTVIAPGASIPVPVTFDPLVVGSIAGQLVINSNDPNGPTTIALNGFGQSPTPYASVVRIDNNNLGDVSTSGGSARRDNIFTITNDGAAPLVVSAIQLTSGTGDFSLTGLPSNLSTTPITLAFDQSFSFGAAFTPKDAGLDQGVITIVTNDSNHPTAHVDVVGTGLSASLPLHWGNDYVALDTGAGPLLTKSDKAGNFDYFLPANTKYHLAIFDPVSGQIAEGYSKSGPSGTNLDLTYNLAFTASNAPDTDYDGLPDNVEWTIGTNPSVADSAVPGISDLAALQQGLLSNASLVNTLGIIASVQLQGSAQAVVLAGSLISSSKQLVHRF